MLEVLVLPAQLLSIVVGVDDLFSVMVDIGKKSDIFVIV